MSPTRYLTVNVDGLNVFYREEGPPDAPTVTLLHGFPSSSRMWQPLATMRIRRHVTPTLNSQRRRRNACAVDDLAYVVWRPVYYCPLNVGRR